MASDSKKNNKMLIGGICAAVVVVIAIIVAVIAMNSGKLGDSYFVSDDTKYVLTLENDEESGDSGLVRTHVVYTYVDDTITGMKTYAEYNSEAAAKSAYDTYVAADGAPKELSAYALDGKYVILTAEKSEYENLTANDVKEQVEFMEMLKKMAEQNDESEEVESDDTDIIMEYEEEGVDDGASVTEEPAEQ